MPYIFKVWSLPSSSSVIGHSPCHVESRRDFIPRSAFKLPPGLLPVWTTPLFKEEWNFRPLTLVTDINGPRGIHRSRLRPGFSSYNDPVYPFEIEIVYRSKKRFKRYEFNFCSSFAQMVDSESILLIFNTDSHPNVGTPGKFMIEFKKAFRSFCQKLETMPVGLFHHMKDPLNKFSWNILMEKITHRIHKYSLRFLPNQWQFQNFLM